MSEDSRKLLFVEKLAFQRQYHTLRSENRASLNAYLMGLYDLDENQPTTYIFLVEDDRVMWECCVLKRGA